MNRKFLLGVAIGAILAASPVLYLSRNTNSLDVNPENSSVISLPDVTQPAPLDDFKPTAKDIAKLSGLPAANLAEVAPSLKEDRIREIVREEIRANPSVVIDAIKADTGAVLNALNSFLENQRVEEEKNRDVKTLAVEPRLTASEGYPFVGNPNGEVELFYYFDVNCHYCKLLEPELDRFIADNPDVKVVHREMPILADSSRYAAQLSGLMFSKHPDKYADFHHRLMTMKPGMTTEDIDAALANAIGLENAAPIITMARNPADIEGQAVAKRVTESLAAAGEAGVTGTPFVIVKDSGLVLRGAAPDSYAQFQSMAIKARAKNAEKAAK
jgi:Protein-disulfide isomerase